MRNAINKDFFREIKYTLNRYVSILLIVALGVAFLAGIRATCPDMKLTLDHYLDEADYMDLRVLSTLGLTGEDLTVIAEVDGVKEVDGAHSYDAFVMNGNEIVVLSRFSITSLSSMTRPFIFSFLKISGSSSSRSSSISF